MGLKSLLEYQHEFTLEVEHLTSKVQYQSLLDQYSDIITIKGNIVEFTN